MPSYHIPAFCCLAVLPVAAAYLPSPKKCILLAPVLAYAQYILLRNHFQQQNDYIAADPDWSHLDQPNQGEDKLSSSTLSVTLTSPDEEPQTDDEIWGATSDTKSNPVDTWASASFYSADYPDDRSYVPVNPGSGWYSAASSYARRADDIKSTDIDIDDTADARLLEPPNLSYIPMTATGTDPAIDIPAHLRTKPPGLLGSIPAERLPDGLAWLCQIIHHACAHISPPSERALVLRHLMAWCQAERDSVSPRELVATEFDAAYKRVQQKWSSQPMYDEVVVELRLDQGLMQRHVGRKLVLDELLVDLGQMVEGEDGGEE
jgi:hypothetical protein